MFEPDQFIALCRAAAANDSSHKAIAELVERAGVYEYYRCEELTVLSMTWGPMMTRMPHNHEMWALIGIYAGREDNIFWCRIGDKDGGEVEAAGATSLGLGDASPLGRDSLHSVTNPLPRLTAAIHVYSCLLMSTAACLRRRFLRRRPQPVGPGIPARTLQ